MKEFLQPVLTSIFIVATPMLIMNSMTENSVFSLVLGILAGITAFYIYSQ